MSFNTPEKPSLQINRKSIDFGDKIGSESFLCVTDQVCGLWVKSLRLLSFSFLSCGKNKKNKNAFNKRIGIISINYRARHSINYSYFDYVPELQHHSLHSTHPFPPSNSPAVLNYMLAPRQTFSPSVLVNLPSNSLSHQPREHLLLEAVFDHPSPRRLHQMPPPAMCMLCIYLSDNFCALTNICSFNCPSPHTVSSLMARSKSFIPRSPVHHGVFYNRDAQQVFVE